MKKADNAFSVAWRVVAILVFVVILIVLGSGFYICGLLFAQQGGDLLGLVGVADILVICFFAGRIVLLQYHLGRDIRSIARALRQSSSPVQCQKQD
jgi:hypothetical protein